MLAHEEASAGGLQPLHLWLTGPPPYLPPYYSPSAPIHDMEVEEDSTPPLLSLPDHLLDLVLSQLQVKNGLRSTCRDLRLAVNARTSALAWSRPNNSRGRKLRARLSVALTAACPGIKQVDCRGQRADNPRLKFNLSSCPPSMDTLLCRYTQVRQLSPLAVTCAMLATLDCSNTCVSDLGPLSACTVLQTLNCSGTPVADLAPLAACAQLQTLNCSSTRTAGLGPLSACTMLRTLSCSGCQGVVHLGALSACTVLQTLDCSNTRVSELGPLSSCLMLQALKSRYNRVSELGPLAACTRLRTLDCSHCRMVSDLGPLAACKELELLSCRSCQGFTELGPLAGCTMLRNLDLSHTNVVDLGPLSTLAMLLELDCSGCGELAELGPLSACTALRKLNCRKTAVADLGPLAGCTALFELECTSESVPACAEQLHRLRALARDDGRVGILWPFRCPLE